MSSAVITALVSTLATLEVFVFALIAGRGRGTYNVPAPAMTGHPDWERLNRIHQNSLEQLLVFLPLYVIAGAHFDHRYASILGIVFVIARVVYAVGYAKSADGRRAGAMLTFLALILLGLMALIGTVAKVFA